VDIQMTDEAAGASKELMQTLAVCSIAFPLTEMRPTKAACKRMRVGSNGPNPAFPLSDDDRLFRSKAAGQTEIATQ
jgi:hypothetical protein